MKTINEEERKKNLAVTKQLRLIDDDFMTKYFDRFIEGTEYILRIILRKNDLHVLEVKSQCEYKSLEGRSIKLDIFAKDSNDKIYDIEVQRADKGAGAKRARFHSSMLDTKILKKRDEFEKLTDTYVIFITENDVIGREKPLYHVERKILETDELFGDCAHIIYVNGAYNNADDPVGRLMHDFKCTEYKKMYSPVLAERFRYFKETSEGNDIMCKLIEDRAREIAESRLEEFRKETEKRVAAETEKRVAAETEKRVAAETEKRVAAETAKTLLKLNKNTIEEIAMISRLSVEEVEKLSREIA
ncbi:MAG: Rpn family recombination-promoting nuclease/putative transposase [Clostridia bacterium]|nr:Rpn family recombination-promoting nuclease/putative transposase [Clostridia bacterium]